MENPRSMSPAETSFQNLRRRLTQEPPDKIADTLAKTIGRDFDELNALIDHALTLEESLLVLEAIYKILRLSSAQKDLVSMQLSREGIFAVKKHLRYLLKIESLQAGSVKEFCEVHGVYFPEIFEPKVLNTFPNKNAPALDLYVRFPIGIHDPGEPTDTQNPVQHKPWRTRVSPPIRADFQRRGGSLPLGILEVHDAHEIPGKLARFGGRVKTLILDGHGDGPTMTVSRHPRAPEDYLGLDNFTGQTYCPLFETLASRGARVVLFSCIVGEEGGLGESIQRWTRVPTYASRESVSGLTIDVRPPFAQYVQFWKQSDDHIGFRPADTRIIR